MSHPLATALGLLGFVLFVAAVIAVAAGVTWIVVKLSPRRDDSNTGRTQAPPAGNPSSRSTPAPRPRRPRSAASKSSTPG